MICCFCCDVQNRYGLNNEQEARAANQVSNALNTAIMNSCMSGFGGSIMVGSHYLSLFDKYIEKNCYIQLALDINSLRDYLIVFSFLEFSLFTC